MCKNIIYLGFHGTDSKSGYSILSDKYTISSGDEHWLGDGVYFFDNDSQMACEWCKAEGYKRKYATYHILSSVIEVNKEELLDLNTVEGSALFHNHRKKLIKRISKASFGVSVTNQKNFDGKVINELCYHFPFKVVYCRFFIKIVADRILRYNSRIPNCAVICVRDTCACIKKTILHK